MRYTIPPPHGPSPARPALRVSSTRHSRTQPAQHPASQQPQHRTAPHSNGAAETSIELSSTYSTLQIRYLAGSAWRRVFLFRRDEGRERFKTAESRNGWAIFTDTCFEGLKIDAIGLELWSVDLIPDTALRSILSCEARHDEGSTGGWCKVRIDV